MTDAPFGFQAIRNLAGGQPRARVYRVTATGNQTGIAVGDPVELNGAGLGIARLSAASIVTRRCLGVISELYNDSGRPLTFSQPTNGPFLPAAVAGWATVYDSQATTFIIQCDASAAETMVGKYVSLTGNAINTAAGTSQMMVKVASADTSVKAFQVIGISPTERLGLGSYGQASAWGNAGIDVEVRIALHAFTSS